MPPCAGLKLFALGESINLEPWKYMNCAAFTERFLISGKEHYGVIINGSNSHNYGCIGFEKEADIKSGSGGVLWSGA